MTAAMSPVRQDEVWRPERPARASEESWRVTPRRTAVVISDLLVTEPVPPTRPSRFPAPAVPSRPVRRPAAVRPTPAPARVETDYARRRRIAGAAGLAVASLAVVGVVTGLGQLLPGAAGDVEVSVPDRVAVERVGAGETLWDVAARVAPESDRAAVVERIRELNVIGGSAVVAGETLRVPDGR